ncbi:MAG: biotin/lipoyl-binding protein, partial [Candidatus Solibacter sp.]|nr:biotin/lipoyl-binding protein [Candidatus Solibacter sp.]
MSAFFSAPPRPRVEVTLSWLLLTLTLLATPAFSQPPDFAPVVSKLLSRTADLPGEFQPLLMVSLHARVPGYVEKVLVDRGSVVKQGQLLAQLSAPEMAARIAEAESRVHAAESDRLQAEAQLAAAQSTWDKLKKAAETPGVIAGNELTTAAKQVDAVRALVSSRRQAVSAAE